MPHLPQGLISPRQHPQSVGPSIRNPSTPPPRKPIEDVTSPILKGTSRLRRSSRRRNPPRCAPEERRQQHSTVVEPGRQHRTRASNSSECLGPGCRDGRRRRAPPTPIHPGRRPTRALRHRANAVWPRKEAEAAAARTSLATKKRSTSW